MVNNQANILRYLIELAISSRSGEDTLRVKLPPGLTVIAPAREIAKELRRICNTLAPSDLDFFRYEFLVDDKEWWKSRFSRSEYYRRRQRIVGVYLSWLENSGDIELA